MKKLLLLTILILILQAALPAPTAAQRGQPPAEGRPTDTLEQFFDQAFTEQLNTYDVPGATVSVVQDGRLVFTKGYGYADAGQKIPVDPYTTQFHIGSVTKLFTWTAVMQLVEQGKLDLHADVNTYLNSLQVPAAFGQPVTLHHLMTHTAGFDDQLSNIFGFNPGVLRPLDQYLKREMPKRVYPPGDVIAYSNWGTGLAGLIVQEVSGEPFEQYIENHLFSPLAMADTSIRQSSGGTVSKGYGTTAGGALLPVQETILNVPAGAISATAPDMANFMIAHLQNGEFNGQRILQAETVLEMHRQHYTPDARLSGIAYGFLEGRRNGQRILYHSGGTAVFFSMLVLVPEHNLGVFYSYNGTGGSEARVAMRQAILDHFYPVEEPPAQPAGLNAARLKAYEGLYRESRFGFSTADKLIFSLAWVASAKSNPDGTLAYRGTNWREVEAGVFKEVDGQGTLIFTTNRQGQIERAYQDNDPHEAQIRMAAWEDPILLIAAGMVCLLIVLSGLIAWAAGARRRKAGQAPEGRLLVWARRAAAGVAGLHLLFYLWAGIAIGLVVARNPLELMGSLEQVLTLPLALPILASIGTVAMLIACIMLWKQKTGSLRFRSYYLALVLSAVLYTGWLAYWNLLGWHF